MGDEEVFRRKLMIDGDGLGDDRRITTLLKTFIKWCLTDENEEESKITCERMLAVLAQCESTMAKSRLTSLMNLQEMQNYERLCENIEGAISEAYQKIDDCKTKLKDAKRVRKNRQEYDVLAKVIQEQPDRRETNEKLRRLESELADLHRTKENLDHKLNLRRKHFSVLRFAIHDLQQLLEVDESDDEEENDKMDRM